jgi:hypothetical protein
MSLEEVEWDGESAMCIRNSDNFFFSMEDVYDFYEDEDIEVENIELMLCEKEVHISQINIDELNDEYVDCDGHGVSHFHPEIAKKVDELNELIRRVEPKLWFQTNKRIKINKDEFKKYK